MVPAPRCGEWRICLGNRKISPSLIGTSSGGLPGVFHHAQRNVAFQLIEEFFGRIVVIVAALVRAADHGHHHFAVFPHLRIAHRRFELILVLFDPSLKVERLQMS